VLTHTHKRTHTHKNNCLIAKQSQLSNRKTIKRGKCDIATLDDLSQDSLFFTNRWFESTSFNSHTQCRHVGLNTLMLYENTCGICSTGCASVAVKNAGKVVTRYGHAQPAVNTWFLYSMPDEHLGAVDHARHDSVSVHSVGVRYLVVTQKNGCIRTLHNFANRIGMVCNQSKSNLPFSKTISVPTKEVRNNLDRNPGLRSPRGGPPPLDMALWHMDNSLSQCVCVNYAWIAWNWWKKQQYILPVESHGKGSLVDRSLHCVLENLGVDGGTGGVEHLDLSAQDLARWIRT